MENRPPFTSTSTPLLLFRRNSEHEPLLCPLPPVARQAQASPFANREENISRMIIEAQERERKRISEELHDNTCQMLSAIKLFIDQLANSKRPKRKSIKKCSAYLADAVTELRNIAHNLKAIWLDEAGLLAAVQRFVSMMETLKNVSIRLNVKDFDESRLDFNTQLVLFRIMQEQVQNILKHASASQIHITLTTSDNTGIISIKDNGVGTVINPQEPSKGAGLRNIRDRVQSINGNMKIETAPGRGFLLEVTFPVPNE